MSSTPFVGTPLGDLEAPGALLAAAESVARVIDGQKELVLMATGPDLTSIQMTNNSLVTLAKVGLRKHVLLLAETAETCERFLAHPGPCFWSSRMLIRKPSDSITMNKFWEGWRFRFYYIKKKYMAELVAGGYSVLQADTDTVWVHDPFRMLRRMQGSSIIAMKDIGLANAGVVYARPGSRAAHRLLEEVAWRVQLFQNHPAVVPRIVPFARPPYYANSDDQTLLNDCLLSAVIGNRTYLGSTARYEARNKYNPTAPEWSLQREARQEREAMRVLYSKQRHGAVEIPWEPARTTTRYAKLPIGDGDFFALAPRTLFAHLPFTPSSAITHLTAARGFAAKVSTLRRIGHWNPEAPQVDAMEAAPGVGGAPLAAAQARTAQLDEHAPAATENIDEMLGLGTESYSVGRDATRANGFGSKGGKAGGGGGGGRAFSGGKGGGGKAKAAGAMGGPSELAGVKPAKKRHVTM